MYVSNVRLGFANNSSSTHSILIGSNRHQIDVEDHEYGWDWFHLKDGDSKSGYLAMTLYQNLPSNLSNHLKMIIVKALTGIDSGGYVDHQSLIDLPINYNGECLSEEFFSDFKEFLMRSDVSIRGGNDNTDNIPFFDSTGSFDHLSTDRSIGTLRTRKKQRSYYTLFNKENGTKTRITFDVDQRGLPRESYDYSLTPELIDLKLTDFCPYNCQFCGKPDMLILTPNGNIPVKDLKIGDLVYAYDLENNQRKQVKIEQYFERDYEGEMIKIETEDGSILELTPEHEIYVLNREWIRIKDAEENDDVFNFHVEKEKMKVKSVKKEYYKGKVYNIGTPPYHNYFASNILVHNCYQDSTVQGRHADKETIKSILHAAAKAEVFEVAFGGGEPTLHPNFIEILKHASYLNIIPNFTSFNMVWSRNEQIKEAVIENSKSFAMSSLKSEDIEELNQWNKSQHERDYNDRVEGTLQVPLGCYDRDIFMRAIEKCLEEHIDFTLLGYKNFGRGIEFNPRDYQWVIEFLRSIQENRSVRIGADTLFVDQFRDSLIEMGIHPILMVGSEGKFSCYIDGVNKKIASSSFTNEIYDLPVIHGRWGDIINENIFSVFPFIENRPMTLEQEYLSRDHDHS
jgi:hypothetical protein